MKLMKNCKTGIVFVIMTMLIGSGFVGSMVFVNADEGEDPPYSLVFEPVYEDFSEKGFPPYVPPETPGNETIQLSLSMTESALSVKTYDDVYTSQSAEYIKYDTPLGISPLTGDSTLSPPWDESDSGIDVFPWRFPWHEEWATDNRDTGYSYLACAGTTALTQALTTHVWSWFKGHYECSNSGEYYVQFEIDYEGLVRAAQIPINLGVGILKIESNVIFQIAGQEPDAHLIFFENSFPVVGEYPVPGPYDEQGPFIIGYDEPIYLQADSSYEFVVQFNIYLDCEAYGFVVSGGGMETDNWFLSANIQPEQPFSIDLVSSEYFLIDDILYYGVWTDPLVFEKGDDVKLLAAVFNVGTDDANGFHIKMGLDDIYEAKTPNPVSLPAGQYGIWGTPYIEWPYDSDIHYVWCYVDCDNDINEMVEDNNIGVHPQSAWGDPVLDIEEATLVKIDDSWPPAWDTIDWQNADVFENGDRVSPLALITNVGEGPTGEDPDYEFHITLYMDDVIFAEGDAPLGPGGSLIVYVEEIGVGPGFDWPDDSCHTFRWEVDDSVHGLHDELQETYCPEVTPANLVWDPTSHNFGTILVGEQSSNYGCTLTNTGGTSTSGTVSVTDDFHIDGSASYDLNPDGGSKTFQVYFKPLSAGSHSGTLQASSANQPSVSLSGVGQSTSAYLEWDPTSHNFGTITVGEQSSNYGCTLTNTGGTSTSGTVSVTDDFHIDGSASYDLNPDGGSKTFQVYFKPLSEGSHSGTLQASSANQPTASLSGTGEDPNPIITLTPENHDFGDVVIDTCSPEFNFTLTNIGTGIATGNISLTGSDPTPFEITEGDGSFSLQSGNTKTIKVRFCPLSTGPKNAFLYADGSNCNDELSPLSGTGVEPNPILSYSPQSIDFGTHLQGWTDSSSFEVWNGGTGTLIYDVIEAIDWITLSGDTHSDSIGPDDKKTVTVNVVNTGSMVDYYEENIEISSNDGSGNVTVSITIEEPTPILTISDNYIDFGKRLQGWTGDDTFIIWNSGTGTLEYNLSETSSWFTLSQYSGDSTGPSDQDTITIYVDNTDTLEAGEHLETIEVTSNGGDLNITVRIFIEVPVPELFVHPTQMYYTVRRDNSKTQQILVKNTGNADLYWQIPPESYDWGDITADPGSGSLVPGDEINVDVIVAVDRWAQLGEHRDSFIVQGVDCDDITVWVDIDVLTKWENTCFLAGTQIAMADGSYKDIEKIKAGDMVLSCDRFNNRLAGARVTKVYHHLPEEMTDYYLIINKNLRVTPNHQLYINEMWKYADDARVGDYLLGNDGKFVRIESVERAYEQVSTYNFDIEATGTVGVHTYIANGALVSTKVSMASLDLLETTMQGQTPYQELLMV